MTNKPPEPSDLTSVMVSLLDLRPSSKVLVVELGNTMASLLSVQGHQVTWIRSDEDLDSQINQIVKNGPYDGAILGPIFAAQQPSLPMPNGWRNLKKTFSEDWLIAYAVENLVFDGSLVSLVPNGLLSNYSRMNLRKVLVERGLTLVATMPQGLTFNLLNISSVGLVLVKRNLTHKERPVVFMAIENSDSLALLKQWKELGSTKIRGDIAGFTSVAILVKDLSDEYRLDPQYYDPTYLQIKAPEGFYEITLGEIAEIKGGVSIDKNQRLEFVLNNNVPYLQVRHITPDSNLSEKLLWVTAETLRSHESKSAKPGDILVTIAGTVGKVVIVPPTFTNGVLFDTSIRRLRITDETVTSESVLEFLRSDLGQLQFRRLTGGTAIPQITTPILELMRIFLPLKAVGTVISPDTSPVENFVKESEASRETTPVSISDTVTQATLIADAIQSQIVDYLRSVQPNDISWKTHFEKTLRSVSDEFLTKTLEETIFLDFPAPIAIFYRRFQMARYNYYERLDRMVSLVEACSYFVYHVLLSDYCHHNWQSQIPLSKDALQAFRGRQSIDYRLKFISEVCDAAREGTVTLFMPEVVDSKVVEVGDLLREQVRNPVAHSAPGSEPYVRSLIEGYLPHIEILLESLRFLSQYTLCRVRSHYYHKEQWSYQAEIYRGAEYDFNIQETNIAVILSEDNSRLIEAERDHLVLLSADNDILDLHPFYQLYFGDETCRESHLCFFKYRQASKLIGESIRSSVEVQLPGIERFQELTGIAVNADNQG